MTVSPDSSAIRGRLGFTSEGITWLVAAVALGLLAWSKSLNLLLVLSYIMLVLLTINGVLARRHALRVWAHAVPLPPVFAGETVRRIVVVENVSAKSATVLVADDRTQWSAEGLPPNERVECGEARSYAKRGRRPAASLVVASGFPFGFLRYERRTEPGADLIVLPAVGHVDIDGLRGWLLRQTGTEGRSRKAVRRSTADLADVRGVRPYRPGDSIRTIHWRSSARRRELMVREYDAAPSPELVLVVEPWLPEDPTAADRENLEAALSLAAGILQAWNAALETRTLLIVAGQAAERGNGPPGDVGLREAMIPLADAVGAASFATIEPAAFGRSLARSARLVVSSRPNAPLAAALSHATGKLFLSLCSSQPPPWYRPPEAIVSDDSSRKGKTDNS